MNNLDLQPLIDIFRHRGQTQYGAEAVSQLEHALQCATLAETAQASPNLITAALFHDFGHLIHDLGEDAAEQGIDDCHEHRAIPTLSKYFGPEVTEPIRRHVQAKRYLCRVDKDYWASLSAASKTSLKLQGGIFSEREAAEFIAQPHSAESVSLRRWDDLAKVPAKVTPPLEYFLDIAHSCQ